MAQLLPTEQIKVPKPCYQKAGSEVIMNRAGLRVLKQGEECSLEDEHMLPDAAMPRTLKPLISKLVSYAL